MTKKELIAALADYPDDIRIMTVGHEGGYRDVEARDLVVCSMVLNVNEEWYYGPHQLANHQYYIDKALKRGIRLVYADAVLL